MASNPIDTASIRRRMASGEIRNPTKGRRGRFVWHVYRPSHPTRFGIHAHRPVSATYEGSNKFSFSLRWMIGWVIW